METLVFIYAYTTENVDAELKYAHGHGPIFNYYHQSTRKYVGIPKPLINITSNPYKSPDDFRILPRARSNPN